MEKLHWMYWSKIDQIYNQNHTDPYESEMKEEYQYEFCDNSSNL